MVLEKIKQALIEFVFPSFCLGCGVEGSFLCPSCIKTLKRIYPPYCRRCGTPLSLSELCPTCLKRPPVIDGIRSPFIYTGLIRQAIHSFKYDRIKALASPLARLLADYFISHPIPGEVLVPVPLHSKRLRERGYNQAALLARELGRLVSLPFDEKGLIRQVNTASQVFLSAEQRRVNVEGAFRCLDRRFEGRKVILVDDVCTTGSTLDECARVLKEAGAISVWGLTLAREVLGSQ